MQNDGNLGDPQNYPEIRSEEIQEIISQVPTWIIRWGITAIFAIFLVLLTISWFVKYPDIIKAKLVLTTSPPVMTLVSRSSGTLVLLKNDNDWVEDGDHIAYIMSSTKLDDVLLLEKYILELSDGVRELPSNHFRLGELQDSYNEFINALENLENYNKLDPTSIQITQLKYQLAGHVRLREVLIEQSTMSKEETSLAHKLYVMDSTLYAQKLLPSSDHINAKISYLQNVRSNSGMKINISNEEIQIQSIKNQILELDLSQREKQSNLTLAYTNALRILRMRIDRWKETNVFTSHGPGTVAFLGFLENNMFIEQGKPVFSLVPKTGSVYAQAEIPIAGSGKIKVGQRVNIRLENYPSQQFGIVYGEIKEISVLPTGDKYMAKINLTNGLITSNKIQLPFKQHLQGETEIITEELRLLERVFYQLRNVLQFS